MVHFAMRLAGHLGMTLRELEERMDSQEFSLWQEFYFKEPFGNEQRYLARILAMLFNVNRTEKSPPPLDPEELLFPTQPERTEQTPDEMKDFARDVLMAFNPPS